MATYIITTRGSDGGLKGSTTRTSPGDAALEVEDELYRVEDDPGATIQVRVMH